MPTYEYECLSCKHRFEKLQKITDEPLKECPKCKGDARRLIGAGSGIIFKGSGFYATDYRSSDYKKRQKEDNSAPVCDKRDSSETCKGCPASKLKNE